MKKLMSAFFGILLVVSMSSCSILNKYPAYPAPASYHILNASGETYNDSLKNINIDWVSGKINILVSDEYSGVTVFEKYKELYSDEMLCRVLRQDEDLNIKFCASNVSIPNNVSKTLEIYVPSIKVLDELVINNVSSSIHVKDIQSQEIKIDNVSGSTKIENCKVKDLNYDGVSGSLVCLINQITTDIKVNQVSGSTLISLPSSIAGFNVNYKTDSGSMNSDFDTEIEDNKVTYKDENYLNITVDSVSGSLSVVRFKSDSVPLERESVLPSESVEDVES